MGSTWFAWQSIESQLLITQEARDNRVLMPAAWWVENDETKDIIGDRDEKTGGTWFGCSKQGRVAFLVDVTPSSHPGAELLTVKFLKGKMTPKEFAKELDIDKNLSLGLTFYFVVADIHSQSIVYISKKSQNKEVDEIRDIARGFYYIDSTGIYDLSSPLNKLLEDKYNEVFTKYKNRGLSMKAGELMSDDQVMVREGKGECGTSKTGQKGFNEASTMLEVKHTGKANFYEIYFENNKRIDRQFNFDIEATKPAVWDEDKKILRGQPDNNFGTWFGISTKGKVAFLVDPSVSNNLSPSDLRPVDFLRGEMSPWDYAKQLSEDSAFGETINKGLVYDIIVADINTNSMFYIAKKNAKEMHVNYEEVDFGVHTLSSVLGLDIKFPKELSMKDLFNEMIGNNRIEQVQQMKQMAEKFVDDPKKADKTGASSSFDIFGDEDRYKTMSTTALVVKPNKEVMFYERYFENGKWQEQDFPFKIE
ncbi:unnamed protein product [Arabis nemorensis]|uniref:Uncharacterized protein n=1 Tax=Arabis nemorensis TaxID=586526 RepID=A0A565ARD4_9BRAS|nr:unnamed protein product [Arabis nemorensis]